MDLKEMLEQQIEQLRLKMYKAYKDKNNYEKVLIISEELDALLNRLDEMNNNSYCK